MSQVFCSNLFTLVKAVAFALLHVIPNKKLEILNCTSVPLDLTYGMPLTVSTQHESEYFSKRRDVPGSAVFRGFAGLQYTSFSLHEVLCRIALAKYAISSCNYHRFHDS